MIRLVLAVFLSASAFAAEGPSPERAAEVRARQPERLTQALARVAPAEAEPRVYFVGFAGDGAQRVFAEEIKLAAQRADERFGTRHRELFLMNDRRDLDGHPLASPESLARAMSGLGKIMNTEHDVLFLALSSNGLKNSRLVADNPGIFQKDLTAKTLAKLLDEARIRWRIIVVSACFAGSFIKPLANENTIVLTAAASDRSSFGCSDDRELTYFGEAFYRDALSRPGTLREAFEFAKLEIARQEREQGLEFSRPQAHFGAALEAKLIAMAKSLARD